MLHRAAEPLARILLVGPFAHERHSSYIPWVRWARYLAARRIECLRFDYRGVGESTGVFEQMSVGDWIEDVEVLARWLKARSPDLPLILHGLDLGGILAGKVFEAGIGDGLLLWAPPSNANQPLRATVLRCIALEQAFLPAGSRKPASGYFQQLESGSFLDLDGYLFTCRLWHDSLRFQLPAGMLDEATAVSEYSRPVRIVKLDIQDTPLVYGATISYDTVDRDFSQLFQSNFEWITTALTAA